MLLQQIPTSTGAAEAGLVGPGAPILRGGNKVGVASPYGGTKYLGCSEEGTRSDQRTRCGTAVAPFPLLMRLPLTHRTIRQSLLHQYHVFRWNGRHDTEGRRLCAIGVLYLFLAKKKTILTAEGAPQSSHQSTIATEQLPINQPFTFLNLYF